MVTRAVATKLSEEEHTRLVDECTKQGISPSSFIKMAIMNKLGSEDKKDEQPIEKVEIQNDKTPMIPNTAAFREAIEEEIWKAIEYAKPQPTLEESLAHMKNCRNPECKYGRKNVLKNL